MILQPISIKNIGFFYYTFLWMCLCLSSSSLTPRTSTLLPQIVTKDPLNPLTILTVRVWTARLLSLCVHAIFRHPCCTWCCCCCCCYPMDKITHSNSLKHCNIFLNRRSLPFLRQISRFVLTIIKNTNQHSDVHSIFISEKI